MSEKIAICATGSSATSPVDERFGRCLYFMIWDPESKQFELLANSGTEAAHGAGTGAVQSLMKKNVGLVISHRIGPKAFEALKQGGVKIFSGVAGKTVEAALQSYKAGELQELLSPNN
ncbi:MAG: NifB/NifX family molybdenum-iron cluster-binding protein [Syntrophomonadaceae bacterium]|nr:NifB/NifX family molybdenum-iron cluster-binding protein [Syntrophomonadaceae bacterium]MDD3024814.1 NifB/NifX family molybdenum-iron cluster-binding protein [Syntrophomonadaceae bacterium]